MELISSHSQEENLLKQFEEVKLTHVRRAANAKTDNLHDYKLHGFKKVPNVSIPREVHTTTSEVPASYHSLVAIAAWGIKFVGPLEKATS